MKKINLSKKYICPVCGKIFYIPYQSKGGGRTNWVFKIRVGNKKYHLCSYSCHMNVINLSKEEKEKILQ